MSVKTFIDSCIDGRNARQRNPRTVYGLPHVERVRQEGGICKRTLISPTRDSELRDVLLMISQLPPATKARAVSALDSVTFLRCHCYDNTLLRPKKHSRGFPAAAVKKKQQQQFCPSHRTLFSAAPARNPQKRRCSMKKQPWHARTFAESRARRRKKCQKQLLHALVSPFRFFSVSSATASNSYTH